jgi:hypothetical protein
MSKENPVITVVRVIRVNWHVRMSVAENPVTTAVRVIRVSWDVRSRAALLLGSVI